MSGDGFIAWNGHSFPPYQVAVLDVRQQFRVLREHMGIRAIWGVSTDGSFALAYDGSYPRPITALSLGSEARAPILKHPEWNLYRGRFSRDDNWVVFTGHDPARGLRAFVAPFRGMQPVPVEEWRDLEEGTSASFSPAGDRLYFTSKRDGRWCIYALPLDPRTMRAAGEAVALAHLHGQYTASGIACTSTCQQRRDSLASLRAEWASLHRWRPCERAPGCTADGSDVDAVIGPRTREAGSAEIPALADLTKVRRRMSGSIRACAAEACPLPGHSIRRESVRERVSSREECAYAVDRDVSRPGAPSGRVWEPRLLEQPSRRTSRDPGHASAGPA